MSEFKVQTRPEDGSKKRHRKISSLGQRAAVFTAACALLIGVGAAGQATESNQLAAASDTQQFSADDIESKLSMEKAEIQAKPAQEPAAPEIKVAPQAAEPAPKAAPKPAAKPAPKPKPKPAPAPAPAPKPAPKPAPAVALNDPAGAQAYAAGQLASYGWSADQMPCLKTLWTKESDWTTTATNPSSGAYGIVQSLPAEKMASAGADYRTNYRTQIKWGLNYIKERYQSPCGALDFHLSNNWY
jgi:outer membrane biosynthesis protein TonB